MTTEVVSPPGLVIEPLSVLESAALALRNAEQRLDKARQAVANSTDEFNSARVELNRAETALYRVALGRSPHIS